MSEELAIKKKEGLFAVLEVLIIIVLALVPLFMKFPYRVNIFLSWEGAYRLSQGQIPFKDFGMPLGYMYWVIPAIFFKIFGAQMITLVKAQVLINIMSGLAFRSILKSLSLQPGVRLLSVLLYCVSFSFFNFWPWYNHTVIVYEMIGLAFLMKYMLSGSKRWIFLSLSALFVFFSFFTKQDGGALAFMLCLSLLVYYCIKQKQWRPTVIFLVSFVVVAFAIIAPLTQFNFSYWFNHGQAPHTSRVSPFEIVDEFLFSSQWIKFYLLLIVLFLIVGYRNLKQLFNDEQTFIFVLLTIGILVEAAILQVTSYTPPDNNIFFHSFAFAFIISAFAKYFHLDLNKFKPLLGAGLVLMLWWSGVFWKYIKRLVPGIAERSISNTNTTENVVNRNTYQISAPTGEIPVGEWKFLELKSFQRISMPKPTIDGINRLLKMAEVKNSKNFSVLNMTELTPLAVEMNYQLERGAEIPLWYHLGVSMFNKQAQSYEQKIRSHYYDVVLFEYVPSLNNFYPFRVRDTLINHYQKLDSFPAPRQGNTQGTIEVYVKP